MHCCTAAGKLVYIVLAHVKSALLSLVCMQFIVLALHVAGIDVLPYGV
jgi:hypothetical protein